MLFARLVFTSGMGQVRDELGAGVPCVQKPFDIALLRRVLFQVASEGGVGDSARADAR